MEPINNRSILPIGSLVESTRELPPNFCKCHDTDGKPRIVPISEMPELYSVILNAYGSSKDNQTFQLPDFKNCWIKYKE